MSTKSKIAVFAALATLVAAPAFAGDQNTATELQDSGRYVPQAQVQVRGIPTGAYASAQKGIRAQGWNAPTEANDFQLVGHN
jgi:hypothetical protein